MNEKLYFVGLTSIFESLLSHEKDQPLYYSIGRQKISSFHGIIREKWAICLIAAEAARAVTNKAELNLSLM